MYTQDLRPLTGTVRGVTQPFPVKIQTFDKLWNRSSCKGRQQCGDAACRRVFGDGRIGGFIGIIEGLPHCAMNMNIDQARANPAILDINYLVSFVGGGWRVKNIKDTRSLDEQDFPGDDTLWQNDPSVDERDAIWVLRIYQP